MTQSWEIPDPFTFLDRVFRAIEQPTQTEPVEHSYAVAITEPQEPTPEAIARPGCTAADNAGVALYHLEGLALEGKPNFGVLRITKERLEEGAAAAGHLGRNDLAEEMLSIAGELPEVHDAEAARRLAQELRPLAYTLWDLGARCKGSLTPEDMARARALSAQVRSGEITFQEAVRQVRENNA